jgi:YidC/Oxa1 family membrane protein insertase
MTSLALLAPIKLIVEALKPVLVFFHDKIGVGWGMSIVLLTVCVRAALSPLMVKQFKSMKAMVAYAPEIKKVQEKYKDDKERQRQEVMKVYQENKINPFASCLPLVAQLPFFIGLFYLLQTDLRHEICGVTDKTACGAIPHPNGAEKFLFIPDLTGKATGGVLAALIVLYIGSQLLSSVLTPSTGDRNQRMLMYGLPFVFTLFIINFPAGLIVYWITTNLWTVGQSYILRKRLGPIKAPDAADGGPAAKPARGADDGAAEPPPRGLMARLAEATAARQSGTAKEPATAGAKPSGGGAKPSGGGAKPAASAKPARSGPPPPPPRKKKKRSGRRR